MLIAKLKTKLSLVDDYIFIERVKCYYSICSFDDVEIKDIFAKIVSFCNQLKKQYCQVFLRLKMLNLSYEILNRQLEQTKNVIFAEKTNDSLIEMQKLNKNLQILQTIQQNLPKNMKKLSLNSAEINFILQNV